MKQTAHIPARTEGAKPEWVGLRWWCTSGALTHKWCLKSLLYTQKIRWVDNSHIQGLLKYLKKTLHWTVYPTALRISIKKYLLGIWYKSQNSTFAKKEINPQTLHDLFHFLSLRYFPYNNNNNNNSLLSQFGSVCFCLLCWPYFSVCLIILMSICELWPQLSH